MRVPANVLSRSLIRPKSPMGLKLEGMGLVQDGAGHLKGPFPAGSGLSSTSSVTGAAEGNAPVLVGFEVACSRSTYTPLWLKGTQCPTQWSSGPEMGPKTNLHWWLRPQFRETVSLSYRIRAEALPP